MNGMKKLVVVGDRFCGKTCLLVTFSKNEFPEYTTTTIYDTYSKTFEVDGQQIEMALWDTAGVEDYDRLRPLSYPESNVVLICFSIDDPDSLANVEEKWAPEVKRFCQKVPIILVGNKLDLRYDRNTAEFLQTFFRSSTVKYTEGLAVSQKIEAADYFECSAKNFEGVEDVFIAAARRVSLKPLKKETCIVL